MFLYVYISGSLLAIVLSCWDILNQNNKITLFDLFAIIMLGIFSRLGVILIISATDIFDNLERFNITLFEKKKKKE